MDLNLLKTTKYLGITLGSLAIMGCDSGNPGDQVTEELSAIVERGIDISSITQNPTGTPGFPYKLENGETISFSPSVTDTGGFLDSIPLGTFATQSSGYLRQGSSSSSIYFPVNEDSFRYIYATAIGEGDNGGAASTQEEAFLQYSFEHTFSRINDFIPEMQIIQNSSSGPGTLDNALRGGGNTTSRNKTITDAISSIGKAAIGTDATISGVADSIGYVRRGRSVVFEDITSTNADLAGDNPVITGNYTITDTWHAIEIMPDLTLNLLHDRRTQVDLTTSESESGTFTLRLNKLTN